MHTILRYNGAKSSKIAKEAILHLIPSSIARYAEVFVGGGSIFFEQPTTLRRWINDSNSHLMSLYQDLRDDGDSFIAACRALPAGTVEERRDLHARLLYGDELPDSLRYFVLNRLSRNGKVDLTERWKHRTYFQEQLTLDIAHGERLAQAAEILKGTRITSLDFEQVLSELGPDDFAFLDPPYICETRLSPSAALYEKRFSMEDHARLRRCLVEARCRWLLTYDDNEMNRERFKEFDLRPLQWTYRGNNRRIKGKELIITNYSQVDVCRAANTHPRAA